MRKLPALLFAIVLVFSLVSSPVAAVEPDDAGTGTGIIFSEEAEGGSEKERALQEPEEGEEDVTEEPGDVTPEEQGSVLTPDSPFYFLKRFIENIRLLLTFSQEKKVALLTELAEERARELEALTSKYVEGELTGAQLAVLEKALNNLILFTEKLIIEIEKLEGNQQGPGGPEEPGGEPGGEEPEEEEPMKEPGEKVTGEPEVEDQVRQPDKYQWRIFHLKSVAARAPEAAQKGMATAIDNAVRQRERAVKKGKLPAGEPAEETEEPGGPEEEAADEEQSIGSENEEGKQPEKGKAGSNKKLPEKDKPAKKTGN